MNRSKLEVASWIAGIVSALIAAYALLPNRTVVVAPPQASQDLVSQAPEHSPSVVDSATLPRQIVENKSSISDALVFAKKIVGTSTRDTELERLARLALSRREYHAAVEAVATILGTSRRDELLDLTHCYASYLGDVSSANAAVKLVLSTKTKTTMLLRSSKLAALESGEGRNEPECNSL